MKNKSNLKNYVGLGLILIFILIYPWKQDFEPIFSHSFFDKKDGSNFLKTSKLYTYKNFLWKLVDAPDESLVQWAVERDWLENQSIVIDGNSITAGDLLIYRVLNDYSSSGKNISKIYTKLVNVRDSGTLVIFKDKLNDKYSALLLLSRN